MASGAVRRWRGPGGREDLGRIANSPGAEGVASYRVDRGFQAMGRVIRKGRMDGQCPWLDRVCVIVVDHLPSSFYLRVRTLVDRRFPRLCVAPPPGPHCISTSPAV